MASRIQYVLRIQFRSEEVVRNIVAWTGAQLEFSSDLYEEIGDGEDLGRFERKASWLHFTIWRSMDDWREQWIAITDDLLTTAAWLRADGESCPDLLLGDMHYVLAEKHVQSMIVQCLTGDDLKELREFVGNYEKLSDEIAERCAKRTGAYLYPSLPRMTLEEHAFHRREAALLARSR